MSFLELLTLEAVSRWGGKKVKFNAFIGFGSGANMECVSISSLVQLIKESAICFLSRSLSLSLSLCTGMFAS